METKSCKICNCTHEKEGVEYCLSATKYALIVCNVELKTCRKDLKNSMEYNKLLNDDINQLKRQLKNSVPLTGLGPKRKCTI